MSAEDYALLEPVLRLASKILDDVNVAPFFMGLSMRPLEGFVGPGKV